WSFDLQSRAQADGAPERWFEELYAKADGKSGFIPWENAAPRDRLAAWLADNPGDGRTALDVGCGLGDNAALLAAAGYCVTAFDLSATAAEWARTRFPD
ncbi:MAG: methyltransferase domain-containing protein, partial [Pseudomonadota bacterium]